MRQVRKGGIVGSRGGFGLITILRDFATVGADPSYLSTGYACGVSRHERSRWVGIRPSMPHGERLLLFAAGNVEQLRPPQAVPGDSLGRDIEVPTALWPGCTWPDTRDGGKTLGCRRSRPGCVWRYFTSTTIFMSGW